MHLMDALPKKKIMNYKQNIDLLMFINMNLDLKICQESKFQIHILLHLHA